MDMEAKIIAALITAVAAIIAASIPVLMKARARLHTIEATADSIEKIAGKIDHSINQRPSTMSDRLDMVQATVNTVRDVQQQHTTALSVAREQDMALAKDLTTAHDRDRQIAQEVDRVRNRLDEHIDDARGPLSRIRHRIGSSEGEANEDT